jgi:hypothetical protein
VEKHLMGQNSRDLIEQERRLFSPLKRGLNNDDPIPDRYMGPLSAHLWLLAFD